MGWPCRIFNRLAWAVHTCTLKINPDGDDGTEAMYSREHFTRGAIRGVELGVLGTTRVVEGIHQAAVAGAGRRVPAPGTGLTEAVYQAVRRFTSLATLGGLGLHQATRALRGSGAEPVQPWQLHCVSGVNAAWGDSLQAHDHPWAMPMGFAAGHDPDAFTTGLPAWLPASPSPHVVLFIHGLGMNELAWQSREGAALPERLTAACDCQPLFLRYNTGRPIHDNGADLAEQLEALVAGYPVPVQSLTLVGHSMGGLVALSAAHQGQAADHSWPRVLRGQCCLGAPHQGAKLETAGNWFTHLLAHTSYSAPLALVGQWRSAGIKDLRHGSLRAEDWLERDRNDVAHFHPHPVDPVPGTHYLFVGTTLAGIRGGPLEKTLGDGLVTPWSALNPRLREPAEDAITRTRVNGIGHMGLLDHPAVAEELVRWYAQAGLRPGA
jgi:pimeloyl-ACP methyl ester carboxylesterase